MGLFLVVYGIYFIVLIFQGIGKVIQKSKQNSCELGKFRGPYPVGYEHLNSHDES